MFYVNLECKIIDRNLCFLNRGFLHNYCLSEMGR